MLFCPTRNVPLATALPRRSILAEGRLILIRSTLQRVLALTGVALLLVGIVLQTGLAAKDPNNDLNGVHWGRKNNPFDLEIGNNLRGTWKNYLSRAMGDWDKSDVVNMDDVSGGTAPSKCAETKGMVELCNSDYGDTGWLGLTRLYFQGDLITAATVRLNDFYFNNRGQYSEYDSRDARQHTICHELGHTVGLPHTDNGSCMNPSQTAVFDNLKPVQSDYRTLEKLYQKKDKKITLGTEKNRNGDRTRATGTAATDETLPTSCTVAKTPGQRETVIEETMKDGTRVVSYISWIS